MGNALKTYLLVTEKKWHDALFQQLQSDVTGNWVRYTTKEEFSGENLNRLLPDLIFIPHWSYIIPKEIYSGVNCIVFHMTDLPYGRGGSPLQNLIIRGHKETKISAIKVSEGIDTGPVYLKKPLSLEGTAQEIFVRSATVIKEMIREIILRNPIPVEQTGEAVVFKRRKLEESNIATLTEPEKVYDYIRMLDAEGYPKAFIETENFHLEFSNADLENNVIKAHVTITKK